MSATVFVAKESSPGETRVAATPETIKRLIKDGLKVAVEPGLGEGAHISDDAYRDAGATLVADVKAAWEAADVVLKVDAPRDNPVVNGHEASLLKQGAVLVCHVWAHKSLPLVKRLVDGKVSCLAMELIPRISRAQVMDSLSSQANIAGYKAVLLGAAKLDKYFPLLMTAAGTIQPARVVIMGAGVAGLQAIATARRLGAVVEVSDIRPAVKEQVESLGAKFIDLPELEGGEGEGGYAKEVTPEFLKKQQEIVRKRVVAADVVITTAQVPGRPAPRLVTEDMVRDMRTGAVIVDLAADSGGNCECTESGQEVVKHGVTILGYSDLPASLSQDASALYARNVLALIGLFNKSGELQLDLEDEVIEGALLTHAGEVRHAPTRDALAAGA
ncbi:MAG: Re/Si-specific NAD(P)(+) transhydrogenase subunit alpha [Myxococcales bacterium]|nr:Re/Si-specific NAD(P)(+) transhydrogenase subunit alpha [Myxococcales bacterium]MDD9970145.1 Re/Si-specific NAD(P)(+) transhydrogenase subunit alpha [Myxococcales bacterium]